MRFSFTLSKYIARLYSSWFIGVFCAFSFIIVIFDYIELFRRARNRSDIGFGLISKMVLFHLPNTAQQLVPFVVLFSVMLMLWRFGRTSQLVSARAAGTSIWQVIAPIIGVVCLYVALDFTVINPMGAMMMERFEKVDNQIFRRKSNLLAISGSGLWLRQSNQEGYSIVKISKVMPAQQTLENITVYNFGKDNAFVSRLDARAGRVAGHSWRLQDVFLAQPDKKTEYLATYDWTTDLDLASIQSQFLSPDTLSFWELPKYIAAIEKAGLSSVKHKIYWHNTMSRPLLFLSMIILAAIGVYRVMQRRANFTFVIMGIGIAFLLYIFYNVMAALGNSLTVPVILAAWAPALLSLCLMLAFLLHLEDG